VELKVTTPNTDIAPMMWFLINRVELKGASLSNSAGYRCLVSN